MIVSSLTLTAPSALLETRQRAVYSSHEHIYARHFLWCNGSKIESLYFPIKYEPETALEVNETGGPPSSSCPKPRPPRSPLLNAFSIWPRWDPPLPGIYWNILDSSKHNHIMTHFFGYCWNFTSPNPWGDFLSISEISISVASLSASTFYFFVVVYGLSYCKSNLLIGMVLSRVVVVKHQNDVWGSWNFRKWSKSKEKKNAWRWEK